MSADLMLWQFRDPADVAERLELQSCHGCAHLMRISFNYAGRAPERKDACGRGRTVGKKCKQYKGYSDDSCGEIV